MCGLSGIILGKKERSERDYMELSEIFTSMFLLSEARGRHASGVASVSISGKVSLYKLPVPPSRMVSLEGYMKVLSRLSDRTTVLLGHSRWKTVGSEFNNCNNQPVVAGSILGTHNGTIRNASYLFSKYRFPRTAEVDSEILFRMAEASLSNGAVNTAFYRDYLAECQGDLSFVFVYKTDPGSVYLYKGNRPLYLYYSARLRVVLYSSSDAYIKEAISQGIAGAESKGWVPLRMPEKTMYQTSYSDFGNVVSDTFTFKDS